MCVVCKEGSGTEEGCGDEDVEVGDVGDEDRWAENFF